MLTPMSSHHRQGAAPTLPPAYATLLASVSGRIPAHRLITDPLRLLA